MLVCTLGSLGFGLFALNSHLQGGGGAGSSPLGGGTASRTPTKRASDNGTDPENTPVPSSRYELSFDSTITDLLGKEHVRARVLLTDNGSSRTPAGGCFR